MFSQCDPHYRQHPWCSGTTRRVCLLFLIFPLSFVVLATGILFSLFGAFNFALLLPLLLFGLPLVLRIFLPLPDPTWPFPTPPTPFQLRH